MMTGAGDPFHAGYPSFSWDIYAKSTGKDLVILI